MSTNINKPLIGDFADLRRKREESLAAQNAQIPEIGDFSDIRMMRNQNIGLFPYLRNMTQGLHSLYKVSQGRVDDESTMKVYNALNSADPSFDYIKMAIQDWSEALGKLGTIMTQPGALTIAQGVSKLPKNIETVKAGAAGLKDVAAEGGVLGLVEMLAKAFIEPIGDLFESTTGIQMADGSMRALTDEEREFKLKNAVGFGVSLAFGAGLARGPLALSSEIERVALNKVYNSLKAGDRTVNVDLLEMVNRGRMGATGTTIPKGKLAREVITKGTAVGGATGAAYSGILYANEDDVLAQMFLEGVVFAPLGVAFETLGIKRAVKTFGDNAKIADGIANLRQVQNVRDNTIAGVVSHIDAMMRGDDLAEALLQQFDTNPLVIARVTPEQVASIQGKISAEQNLVVLQSVSKDGIHRAIITTKLIANHIDKPFFAKTGLIKDQYISHNGKDYIVLGDEGVSEGNVRLREVNGVRDIPESSRVIEHEIRDVQKTIEIYHNDIENQKELLVELEKALRQVLKKDKDYYQNLVNQAKEKIEALEQGIEVKEGILFDLQEHPSLKLARLHTHAIHLPDQIRDAKAQLVNIQTMFDEAARQRPNEKNVFAPDLKAAQENVNRLEKSYVDIKLELYKLTPGIIEAPLSELRAIVRPEGAYPIERVYHGTAFVFDEFDPNRSNPHNLKGPGAGYFTESNRIGSTYTTKELSFDVVREIKNHEESIATNRRLLDNLKAAKQEVLDIIKDPNADDVTKTNARNIYDKTIEPDIIKAHDAINFAKSEIDRLVPEANRIAPNVRVHSLDIRNPFDTDEVVPPIEVARIFHEFGASNAILERIITGDDVRDNLLSYTGSEKAVNKHLEKMGYDGITHIGGRLMGDEDHRVWIPFRADQVKQTTWGPPSKGVRAGPVRGVSVGPEFIAERGDFKTSMDNLYRHFSYNLFKNVQASDWVPPQGWSFEAELRKFGETIGLTRMELPAFRSEMRARMAAELKGKLSEFDRAFLTAAERVAAREELIRTDKDSHTLVAMANNNGMLIDVEDAGRIVIRDLKSGRELLKTSRFDEAQKFIDRTGQADGANLDFDGGDLPPIAPHLFSAPNFSNEPFSFYRQGRVSRALDVINITFPFLTRNKELFSSMDSRFGTKMFAKVFDALQDVTIKRNAMIRPYYEKLRKIDDTVARMTKAEREMIGNYLDTMTPQEVIDNFLGTRKMSDFEKTAAQLLVDKNVDIKIVMEYRRILKEWDKDAAEGKIPDITNQEDLIRARQDKVIEMERELNITFDEGHAIKLFDEIEKIDDRDKATIGAVARLARAMKGADGVPELNRMEFAAKHKLTEKQLKAALELEKMQKDLAKEFGIDENQSLSGLLTHARLYTEGDLISSIRHFPTDDTKKFYFKVFEGKEISSFETDPIVAMQRFIKGGFDEKLVNATERTARQAIVDEIKSALADKRIKNSQAARQARHIAERYVTDVVGHGDAGGRLIQEVVDNFFDSIDKKEMSPDVRRKIVNVISSTGEAAAQGLRVAAGLRDFFSGYAVSVMRYGVEETHRILNYGVNGLEKMNGAELARLGEIPESGIVNFTDPVEHSGSLIRGARGEFVRKLDRFNQFAFRMSMQKDVYRMFHAGHYMGTFKRAGDALKDYRAKKIDIHEVGRRTLLHKYDVPVIDEFMRMVNDGTMDESAVRFLARQTGQDMVGVYGFANHPSGWNTDVGRVAGQFGQWSMWFRQAFFRETSRGTLTQRSAAMFRLMATQKLLVGAGAAFGLNLTRWQPTDGLFFGGGPVVDFAMTFMKATTGSGYTQAEAQRRLARYLPYDGNRFNVGQIYLPGSFFANDLVKAFELFEQGDPRAAVRAFGVPVETDLNRVRTISGVPVGGLVPRLLEQVGIEEDRR